MPGPRKTRHASGRPVRWRPERGRPERGHGEAGAYWIYGLHAARAALANPRRQLRRLLATETAAAQLGLAPPRAEIVARAAIDAVLPAEAVHQGVAVLAAPLPEPDFAALCAALTGAQRALVVVLDRVSDPQNVGAVLRSAAAFGAAAVIAPRHHAPEPGGALAKAASGAAETVAYARVPNLARALDALRRAGLWCVGLDPAAPTPLAEAGLPARCALVLGAEGPGLRRLTAEHCDQLARIPMRSEAGSLNVSNAAAIALYEYARAR